MSNVAASKAVTAFSPFFRTTTKESLKDVVMGKVIDVKDVVKAKVMKETGSKLCTFNPK